MLIRTRDGAGLYAEERGSGDPLLLLAGQSSSHLMWGSVIDRLAERHRVLVFDYRGTGRSESPEGGYSTPGFAADAVAVLDAFDVPRAHVYGFSMGGRVAQWVAIDHPDRVGALVLGATTPGDHHGVPRSDWANALLARPDDKAALDTMMFTPAWLDGRAERPGVCQDWPVGTSPISQARHYGASQAHDAWDRLPSITAPTLVIHGSDDPTNVPQNAFLLAERIPGSTVHIVDGARHGYWEEFSDEAEQVVLGFLARHPVERRSPAVGAADREQGDEGTGQAGLRRPATARTLIVVQAPGPSRPGRIPLTVACRSQARSSSRLLESTADRASSWIRAHGSPICAVARVGVEHLVRPGDLVPGRHPGGSSRTTSAADLSSRSPR